PRGPLGLIWTSWWDLATVDAVAGRACGAGRIAVHGDATGGAGRSAAAGDRRQRPAAGTGGVRGTGPAGGRADRARPARPLRPWRGGAAVARWAFRSVAQSVVA